MRGFVWDWMQAINISLNRYRYLRIELKDLSWDDIIDEHETIVQFAKQGKKKELGEQILSIQRWLIVIQTQSFKHFQATLSMMPSYFTWSLHGFY